MRFIQRFFLYCSLCAATAAFAAEPPPPAALLAQADQFRQQDDSAELLIQLKSSKNQTAEGESTLRVQLIPIPAKKNEQYCIKPAGVHTWRDRQAVQHTLKRRGNCCVRPKQRKNCARETLINSCGKNNFQVKQLVIVPFSGTTRINQRFPRETLINSGCSAEWNYN